MSTEASWPIRDGDRVGRGRAALLAYTVQLYRHGEDDGDGDCGDIAHSNGRLPTSSLHDQHAVQLL